LVRINDAFASAGSAAAKLVGRRTKLRAAYEHCERINDGHPATIFEAETAVAFGLFAQTCGRRRAAGSSVLAGVWTPPTSSRRRSRRDRAGQSMDHTEFLGDTLTSIAGEKAAINQAQRAGDLRRAVPRGHGRDRSRGTRMRAPLHAARAAMALSASSAGGWSTRTIAALMDLAAPRLFGRHQFDNGGACDRDLRAQTAFKIDAAAFEAGIVNAEWPARMQR